MTVSLFILIALAGILIGIFSGMFGIGGGTLMIPLLNLALGLPILTATATSLFVIAPTSIAGAWRHVRQGTADVRAAITIGLAGAVASTFSSFMSDFLPDTVILMAALLVIGYSAFSVIKGAMGESVSAAGPTAGPTPTPAETATATAATTAPTPAAATAPAATAPAATAPLSKNRFATPRARLFAHIILGLFAGLVAGIVGVGGGFIIVPIGIAYFGYSFKKASGTSLLAIAFIAIPGIITHAVLAHIWYLGGVALMVGTIPGANLGARLITKIPERAARLAFGGLLVLSGALLIINRVLG